MITLTKSEQRLKYLETVNRPLTEDEQAELYRCLHAVYVRERRIAKLEAEINDRALTMHARETAALLSRVSAESHKREVAVPKRATSFEQQLQAVSLGEATIYTMPKPAKTVFDFTLGGVSSGWAA